MQNYLLTLAYDGTNYCGFQVQPNGRSVAQTFHDGWKRCSTAAPISRGAAAPMLGSTRWALR